MFGGLKLTQQTWTFISLTAALGLISIPGLGHHGTNVSYDHENPLTFAAIVTEFRFTNPHAQLLFNVTDERGDSVHWAAELTNPSNLARNGWSRRRSMEALEPGTPITIILFPSKAGTTVGVASRILNENGEQILLERRQELPERLPENP